MDEDLAIASLLNAVADQYRKGIQDEETPANQTRLETLRKLALISQSIRGLMKYSQDGLIG